MKILRKKVIIIEKLEKYWKQICTIIAIITFIGGCFGYFNRIIKEFDDQNEKLDNAMRLSEKSIIWNKEIPKVERAEVCDMYLSAGYDSYTKKLCENVILQDETLAMGKEAKE